MFKQSFLLGVSLVLVWSLCGCSPSLEKLGETVTVTAPDGTQTVTENAVASVERSANETEGKCWDAERENSKVDCTGLGKMECLMLKMQHENTRLVAAATGNSPSPCGRRTTLNDVFKEEVIQKNETVRQGVNTAGSTAKTGIIAGTILKATEKIVDGAGNKTMVEDSDGAVVNDNDVTKEETVTGVSYQGDSVATLSKDKTQATEAAIED